MEWTLFGGQGFPVGMPASCLLGQRSFSAVANEAEGMRAVRRVREIAGIRCLTSVILKLFGERYCSDWGNLLRER